MKKVYIHYVDGSRTVSDLSERSFEKLKNWWLNPKACKTFVISGVNDLLIHKDHVTHMITEKEGERG